MTSTTTIAAPVAVKEFIGLFKPRIAFAISLSALGGMAVTPGLLPEAWQVVVLAVSVFLAAGSAGAFNQWAESDLDARMARTADRLFASGRLNPGTGWLSVIIVLQAIAIGLIAIFLNGWAAFYTFLGAFTYAVIYTLWLKRRTSLNIVIGGLAGSFAVLAGAAAIDPMFAVEPLLLAIVLFLWTPPHFWSLAIAVEEDYERNTIPMLPAITGNKLCARIILGHTVVLSTLALLPAALGMGWIYFTFALTGGLIFTATSVRLVLETSKRRAIVNFLASLGQLLLLLTGAIVDRWLAGGLG